MSDAATIQVLYTCITCGTYRARVTVKARTTEDVLTWMEQVCLPALMQHHAARSPGCNTDRFDEIMVPIDGAEHVGGELKAPQLQRHKLN
jgi:hypothetical protein